MTIRKAYNVMFQPVTGTGIGVDALAHGLRSAQRPPRRAARARSAAARTPATCRTVSKLPLSEPSLSVPSLSKPSLSILSLSTPSISFLSYLQIGLSIIKNFSTKAVFFTEVLL